MRSRGAAAPRAGFCGAAALKALSAAAAVRAGLGAAALRAALAGAALLAAWPLAAQTAAQPAAAFVGEQACLRCHASESRHFGHTVHARAFRLNPRNDRERHVCESCHGPGSRHLLNATDRAGIVGFTKAWGTPVEAQNAQCLGCHEGSARLHWHGSAHASNRVACSDCHNPMARLSASGLLAKASVNETCAGCHPQQRAEFRKRSRMPVLEGKMSCTSCHNPHGSPTRPLLVASSINDTCYGCHAEKRGPFVWEHAPVRENCLNCHEAHGSNQEALLVAPRPFLCAQCHTNRTHQNKLFTVLNTPAGADPSAWVMGRSCQTCHAQVHGSNHPGGVRFLR